MKIVQIRSIFWSVFSCIWTEYGDLSGTYQKDELFNEHEEFCRSFNHINLMILSKLKTIIDKSTSEKKKQ